MQTTLYLVRHGQSDYNVWRRVQAQIREGHVPEGCTIPRLNLQGIRDAARIAQALAEVPIDAIYTSSLERAYHTAGIIAAQQHELFVQGENFFSEDRLMERCMFHPGMNVAQLSAALKRAVNLKSYGEEPDTGEDLDLVYDRFKGAVHDMVRRHEGGNVLAVSHGGIMRLGFYKGVLGEDVGHRKFDIGSISRVIFEGDAVLEQYLNNTDHLGRETHGVDGI